LDSDNIPTRDPTYLFETTEYKEKGAIFWPDFWKTAGENKIFQILEIECQDTWEQEVCFSKKKKKKKKKKKREYRRVNNLFHSLVKL
jgi:hypothetical protein